MDTPIHLGVNEDPRTPAQKEFDYKHEEIFTSAVPQYLTPDAATGYINTFPRINQAGTSSCVAHGKTLVMSIFNWQQQGSGAAFRQLSPMFLYRNRSNFPGEGMIPSAANMQTIKQGAPIYGNLPTPDTEAAANALVITPAITASAKEFAAGKWVAFTDPTDIDQMAYVSNVLGLAQNILIYATEGEWSQAVVRVLVPGLSSTDPRAIVRHCVTILPKSVYKNTAGKRYVTIQDSANFGNLYIRSVDEDFLTARVYQTDYMIAMGSQALTSKPRHQWHTDLTIGSTGPDVVALQQALQFLGLLPNVVNGSPFTPTGTYAGMTKNAVLKLQNEYAQDILIPHGLIVGTGYVGQSTRAWLNSQFA